VTAREARRKSPAGRPAGKPAARPPRPPAPAPEPLAAREGWLVATALVVAWIALFGPNLAGRVFVLGDASQFRPFAEFARERFAATHERTLWNPFVFLGIPTAASLADPRPQWAPGPVLAAWDALTRDPVSALRLLLVGLLAGALSLAWLARALWNAAPAAMALAGFTLLAASGVVGPLAFGHDAQLWCLALTPVAMLATHGLFASTARARPAAVARLALALALLAFAGHPQFMVYGALLVSLLAVERSVTLARPGRLAAFAASALLAMGMSAGSWLPAWEYGPASVRANTAAVAREAARFSGNGLDLLALLLPRAAGYGGATYHGGLRATDFPNHVGAVVALLALAGALVLPGARGRLAARVFAAFVALALLAALGSRLPPLEALFLHLPVLKAFRTPITWLMPATLAIGLLAARGLTSLRAAVPGRAGTPVAGALAIAALVEMSLVSAPILRHGSGPPSRLAAPPPDALAIVASRDPLHRSYALERERFFSNAWIAWRARSVSGLHGAVPSLWDDLRAFGLLARQGFVRALAVRWVSGPPERFADPAALRPVPGGGFELPGALPRAYAAARVVTVRDRADMIDAVSDARFDPTQVAFAFDPAAEGDYPGSASAVLEWRRDDPDRLSLAVRSSERAFVVIADAWAAGWTARVDGRGAPLLLVDAALRGIAVPGGSHALELVYVPPGWRAGRLLAGVGWLAWLALVAWALWPRRDGPPAAATA
jgi:hypothetical protein